LELPAAAELSVDELQVFHEGLALLEMGEPREAVAAFSRMIERRPDFAEAHVGLGIAQAMASCIYPALDHLERAIQLKPESFMAHFLLAQLNFKLRIPQKGYEQAQCALRCASSRQERKMVAQLLQQERERERHGLARPWFNKPFSVPAVFLAGSGLAAALVALLAHMR
jgi:tetratricopeptide (TPR) repeat protein